MVAAFSPTPALALTLDQALAAAYEYNPRIDAERARLRATDEEVPIAKSGYRPDIGASADAGYRNTDIRPGGDDDRKPRGYGVSLTQPVFRGFQVTNAVSQAESIVRAGRETLRVVEQEILAEAVTVVHGRRPRPGHRAAQRKQPEGPRRRTQGDARPLRRRRSHAHRRRPVRSSSRRRCCPARSVTRQSPDQPRCVRADRRPSGHRARRADVEDLDAAAVAARGCRTSAPRKTRTSSPRSTTSRPLASTSIVSVVPCCRRSRSKLITTIDLTKSEGITRNGNSAGASAASRFRSTSKVASSTPRFVRPSTSISPACRISSRPASS